MFFGAKHRRTVRRLPVVPAAELQKQELRREVISWLENRLAEKKTHTGRVFLYGSIVHDHYSSTDIDVVVVFKPGWERTIRRAAKYFHEEIRSAFRQRFGIPLHPKFYLASEEPLLNGYLGRTGKHQEVMLSSRISKHADS